MKLLESGIRVFTLAQGTGVRWLREELGALRVKTPLTDGCLEELVREADSAAWQAIGAAEGTASYLATLREGKNPDPRIEQFHRCIPLQSPTVPNVAL